MLMFCLQLTSKNGMSKFSAIYHRTKCQKMLILKIEISNFLTFSPRSLSTALCDAVHSHLFPAKTLTTSGDAF